MEQTTAVRDTERPHADAFRPDLEGLRGVAILLVLLFHAGVPGTGGGYVGVDVFFVLSGFLITGLLLRERERTGTISLSAFYARRARRILPAAVVVIVATLGVAWFFLSPLDLQAAAGDAVACALSVGNLRFAASAMDYFNPNGAPSPFLHYWSLGVEEQFYLVWPTLLLLVMRWHRPRLAAGVALVAVVVVSYLGALVLTDAAAAWAFYSLPTRAWQLGLGGLLAVTATQQAWLSDRAAAIAGWLGLGAIVASLFVIDPATPYPGTAALLPTLGSAAVVLAGARRGSPGRLLVVAPLRFLGRISYSLYLVHWPILVLPAAGLAVGDELPFPIRLGLAALSIVVAAASYRWVEEPIHRGRRFALPARRTLALAGAAIAATVVVAVGLDSAATQVLDAYGVSSPLDGVSGAGPVVAGADDGGGAGGAAGPSASGPGASGAPSTSAAPPSFAGSVAPSSPAASGSAAPSPLAPPATIPPGPNGAQALPRDIRPPLARASTDWEVLNPDGCTLGNPGTAAHECVFGDPKGAVTVALVGDSHAAQWFPALQAVATERGWRLLTYTKISCRFVDMRIYSRVMKREYTECEAWRQNVVARLKAVRPDLVVVGAARGMAPMVAADDDPTRQGEAMARLLSGVPSRFAILVDTPESRYEVPACIAGHLSDVRACEEPRASALTWRYLRLEQAAAAGLGGTVVDLTDRICPYDPCPVVLDGMIVYRDGLHMTATFSASLAGPLAAALPDLGGAAVGSLPASGPEPAPGSTSAATIPAVFDDDPPAMPRDRVAAW